LFGAGGFADFRASARGPPLIKSPVKKRTDKT
jgi:hypothetical protein